MAEVITATADSTLGLSTEWTRRVTEGTSREAPHKQAPDRSSHGTPGVLVELGEISVVIFTHDDL